MSKNETIINLIRDSPGGFVGTKTVADELDMSTNGATYRLEQLENSGCVVSKQLSRDKAWYLPAAKKTPGPDTVDSRMEVRRALEESMDENRAVTLGDLVEYSEYSRQTVHDRLCELVNTDPAVCSEKTGGSSIFWVDESEYEVEQ